MLHFDSDYMEGAHPAIIERLAATNLDQTSGYGTDEVCERARQRIREACACPEAAVYFLVGGTQANAAVADQILRPWEGIISATTGHITAHAHIKRIYAKTGLHSRQEILDYMQQYTS